MKRKLLVSLFCLTTFIVGSGFSSQEDTAKTNLIAPDSRTQPTLPSED